MEKVIELNGKTLKMRCTALTPITYAELPVDKGEERGDFMRDVQELGKALNEKKNSLNYQEMKRFLRLSWLLLHDAGEDVGKDWRAMLSQWDSLTDPYVLFGETIKFLSESMQTTSVPGKKAEQQ